LEVAETVSLTLKNLHFGVEAFGDSVVTSETPHDDLLSPRLESLAELNELRQAGRAAKTKGVADFTLAMAAACDNGGEVRDGKNDSI
jgi:hypothetical protein